MLESYKVAIKLSLINEVSNGLTGISRQFVTLNAYATTLQSRLDKIKKLNFLGNSSFALGIGLASPFIYAIGKAAELQKQLIGIQLATRGTTQQMESLRASIEDIASQTIFNNIDVSKMAKMIATGTGLSAPEMQSILPEYAKFADVQYLMKGTLYEKSVTEAIRLAHTAQHYDAASLRSYLDLLNKASFIVPGSLSEIGHALKYSQGIAKTALGIDDMNMVLLTSFLNRLGFAGSRGGTNLIAAMTRSIPGVFGSGLLTGKSGEALKSMGMADVGGHSRAFTQGHFDAFAWIKLLSQYVQKEFARYPENIAREHIMKNFQYGFGTQGSRVASLLSSPEALKQLAQIGTTFSTLQGTSAMQETFAQNSVAQQFLNAKNNFVTAMTELGITLLPAATIALKLLNSELKPLIAWIREHQTLVKMLAKGFIYLIGLFFAGGLLSKTLSAVRLVSLGLQTVFKLMTGFGTLLTSRLILGGIVGLGATLSALVIPLASIAAIGAAIYGLPKLWGFLKGVWHNAAPGGLYDQQTALNNQKRLGGINAIAPRNQQTLQVNSQIHLDGRKVAQAVTQHQVKAADKPPSHTGRFDSSMTPYPVMLPIGNF